MSSTRTATIREAPTIATGLGGGVVTTAAESASCREAPSAGHTERRELRTWGAVGLSLAMMVGELVAGTLTSSLALTADGWHMATHAGALAVSAGAYWYARTRAHARHFAFGTGKVHALAGFTNAVLLLVVALGMVSDAVQRLAHPRPILYAEAIAVAALGLLVNLACAGLLHPGRGHDHSHDPSHDHPHDPSHSHDHDSTASDHNLQGAYLHVMADALTSVLAIVALLFGRLMGWSFLDPLSALVGSALIARWGVALVRSASRTLLDVVPEHDLPRAITEALAATGATVHDVHVWESSPGHRACIVAISTESPRPLGEYRSLVLGAVAVDHLTIEVEHRASADHAKPSGT